MSLSKNKLTLTVLTDFRRLCQFFCFIETVALHFLILLYCFQLLIMFFSLFIRLYEDIILFKTCQISDICQGCQFEWQPTDRWCDILLHFVTFCYGDTVEWEEVGCWEEISHILSNKSGMFVINPGAYQFFALFRWDSQATSHSL